MQGWELNPGLPACLVRNLSVELHPGALFHFFLRLFGIPTLGSARGSGRYPGQWSLAQGTALWLLACSETIFAFFSLLSVLCVGEGLGSTASYQGLAQLLKHRQAPGRAGLAWEGASKVTAVSWEGQPFGGPAWG